MQLKPTSAPHAGTQKIVPRGPNFCQESPPPFFHKWVGEVCERNFARDSPLWVRGVGMFLLLLGTKVGQVDFRCNKLVTISLRSDPHVG